MRPRLIPVITLEEGYVVKTKKFKTPVYIGDPINTVRIFNDKEVDEIAIVDIRASLQGTDIDFDHLEEIASESFMPLSYGGGVTSVDEVRRILRLGFEKVILNTAALENPSLVQDSAKETGRQSIVVAIDVRRSLLGHYVVTSHSGTRKWSESPVELARRMEELGAGELLVNSIDRDGMMQGYDAELLSKISSAVSVPVIAVGGAGSWQDMRNVIESGGAAAAAGGSVFVFHGRHSAVLIQYPHPHEIEEMFDDE
ncbi:AglZ/HisF2 family acetamidino modification protein [Akkermansiaceae bacterium]|nr:AglZ/HisF2 family acetamidino modification protein [Akkermansiaceae bacterium]